MKNFLTFLLVAALIGVLNVACNNSDLDRPEGLGEEIPGIEIKHGVTGTVIGSYSNGFGSLLVQVDEVYPIGRSIPVQSSYHPDDPNLYTYQPFPCASLKNDTHSTLIYQNMIQVQPKLPVKVGDKISFSVREYKKDKDEDVELFTVHLLFNTFCIPPDVPIYVVTDLKTVNEQR